MKKDKAVINRGIFKPILTDTIECPFCHSIINWSKGNVWQCPGCNFVGRKEDKKTLTEIKIEKQFNKKWKVVEGMSFDIVFHDGDKKKWTKIRKNKLLNLIINLKVFDNI